MLTLALLLAISDLTPETVSRLQVVWTYRTNAKAPDGRAAAKAAFEATPVLAGDLLYVITPFNQVIALDPENGTERWRFDPRLPAGRSYSEVTARGVAVSQGRVFFGTLDARVIALDAATGRLLWQTPHGDTNDNGNYQVTSPPVAARDVVIVGSSIGDNGRARLPRGVVRAYDAATGKLRWSWDPTPVGDTGAANAWSLMSVDASRDLVFVPTGSASPDFFGGLRPGDNRHANSVVALRASTGKLVWSFQVVHHDLWDYDVAARPELIQVKGKAAIGVLTKMGHYFALDRLTGKPLLPVAERPVPPSNVPGESASATQPFPLQGGVFTSQKFVPRPGPCTEAFNKLRYEGVFTPPSVEGTLLFPGNVGGANWGSGTYDRARGLLFVAANRVATAVRLIPRDRYDSQNHGETGERWGQEYARQEGTPFGMARRTFIGPDGAPCNQEPWGALAAIDVNNGELRWESPILPSLGGPLFVNGVVFFGGTMMQSKLHAFSAETGQKLWETNLPFSAHSTPGTYVWKGKRYVVVAAGGHGKIDGSKIGDAVIAYAVGESTPHAVMLDGKQWTTRNVNIPLESSWCYDNSPRNCERLGRLYTHDSAQQACASMGEGWRLPSDSDWRELARHYGGVSADSADRGKQALTRLMTGDFKAVAGGGRAEDGTYARIGAHGFYWTSTETSTKHGYYYNFALGSGGLHRQDNGEKLRAFSVRCVRDPAR